jgi:hypothetical protein
MKEGQLLIVFPLADVVPTWAIVLALIAAIIIVAAAVFLIRGGKKKSADATNPGDWQQQQGGWNQPQSGAGWNQQPQPGNNPWGTQQPTAAWGNQQQQQPMAATNAWGSPQPASTNPWEQQQPPATTANPWAAQPQQQPITATNPWVAQPQQQPATTTNPWATQPQQQPTAANPWTAQPQQQPTAANPWTAQPQQQPATAANPWAAQPQQQPTTNQWGNQAPTMAAQEPWNQQQQGTSPFGNTTPPQNWNQPAQQDAWNASNAAQPNQFPVNNNSAAPGRQQQPGFGGPAATSGPGGPGTTGGFSQNDADKTILRPPGSAPNTAGGVGYVRVEEGKEPGRIYEVRKEALSIGRSRESDIFLEDLAVSRLHASIVNMGNNSYALKDEGSANGTKVNGQLVNKFQTYPLQEGDRIQLGQTVLVFARH